MSAPAGFGKTTLLAEWLAAPAAGRAAAWVSLDVGDNHPATFWRYVVAALQRARPGVGVHALALLEAAQPPPIEAILAPLLNELAAHDGGRTGSVVEILALLALADQMRGDTPAALASLERALVLAEPEEYVRTFVDEGAPMALLVNQAVGRGTVPGYARRLQAALGVPDDGAAPRQDLVEPLSERELDVLRLLGTHLNGPDIARELVVSVNTMRTHTKNIYAKLGVNDRGAAVRRAEELGLFPRTRGRGSPAAAFPTDS